MLCALNMFGVVVSAILLSYLTNLAHSLYVPHPELQRAIVHKKIIATWDEAKLRCEKEGAMLASPVDSGLLEYMKSSIGVNNHTTPYFIGMRLIDNPEHTVILSLEGIPLEDLPQTVLDMIEQIDPQDGDCLRMDSHDIRTGPCQSRLPYICYKNTTTDTTTTSAPKVTTEVSTTKTSIDCTSGGYTKLTTGNSYKVHDTDASWYNANSTCTSEGGYLAVLNNEEEARAVTDYAFTLTESGYVRVGILDRAREGGWHSVHGEPLNQIFNKWASSRSYFQEACGALSYEGLLDDLACGYEVEFICERSCPY